MTKRRASMREGPLADLFKASDEHLSAQPGAAPPATPSPAGEAAPADDPAPRRLEAVPKTVAAVPAPPADERQLPYTPRGRDSSSYLAIIRVVGVGGAGLNAIGRMMEAGIEGVEFVAINTDAQQLAMSDAHVKVQLGREVTRGLGSGGDVDVGRRTAETGSDRIRQVLRGSDLVFVTAGEGGGTGTGAAPVVARIARELGALTVGIVTTPFRFEGSQRGGIASDGLARLQGEVDTLIVVPNDRLLSVLDRSVSMLDAFRVADDVLRQGVQGICDLITRPGLINLDFADVRTVMQRSGNALMGIGMATGPTRGTDAARRAIDSPLIDHEIRGARGIILSIAGGSDLGLLEVTQAADVVRGAASDEANIIFGATVDEELTGQLWVTVVATDFTEPGASSPRRQGTAEPSARRPPGPEPATASGFDALDDDFDVPPFLRR